MFENGEMVFYKKIGVCEVVDITSLDFAMDTDQKYYVMKSIYKNGINYVPVGVEIENIRNIISKEEAEELVRKIPEIEVDAVLNLATKEMTEYYEEKLNTGDPLDILELSLSIDKKKEYLSDEKKKFGAIDDNYLKKALDMLYEELAAALGIGKEEMPKYIEENAGYAYY